MMTDRDTLLTDSGAVAAAIALLEQDDLLMCVTFRLKASYSYEHYDIGCMVFKREMLGKVAFYSDKGECNCDCVKLALHANGYKIRHLSDDHQGKVYSYGTD
jgi:hypothetical protein